MARLSTAVRKLGAGLLILPLILIYPSAIPLAEALTDTPAAPPGPAADTYKYNEATGMWENEHYTWDPITHKTHPKDERTYSYNPATGLWDTTEWIYNAATGKYEPNIRSVADPPQNNETVGDPAPAAQAPGAPVQQAEGSTPAPGAGAPAKQTDSLFSGFYNASISNDHTSTAVSGDATVTHNTFGGNAQSGDASAVSTILNLLQSSTSIGDLSKVATFTTNIDGNVIGDFHIDPGAMTALQPAVNSGLGSNIQVATATDNAINNNISVSASSGDATVSGNTSAGDATSGDANAVVNLVNVLNSSIAAGQSFLGFLNINGNFNGDILLPPGSINALLAANNTSPQANLNLASTADQGITNTVSANAGSGDASVTHNTSGGSAATGNAATKLTVLNLTGHDVVGSNSLLVFVNVLGQWVGAILDTPTGTTAAALGGGVTQNDINSDVSLTNTNTSQINNSVNVAASSGDASVDHNTTAGSARSGDATASVNIANLAYSNLALSDWFGILFINVFGTWNGSFGIDTEAGTLPKPDTEPVAAAPASQSVGTTPQVFRFAPHKSPAGMQNSTVTNSDDPLLTLASYDTHSNPRSHILGIAGYADNDRPGASPPAKHDIHLAVAALMVGAGLAGIERALAYRDHRQLVRGKM